MGWNPTSMLLLYTINIMTAVAMARVAIMMVSTRIPEAPFTNMV